MLNDLLFHKYINAFGGGSTDINEHFCPHLLQSEVILTIPATETPSQQCLRWKKSNLIANTQSARDFSVKQFKA